MENKKYHNVRKVQKSKRKIVESKSIPLNIETVSPFLGLLHFLVKLIYFFLRVKITASKKKKTIRRQTMKQDMLKTQPSLREKLGKR
jgi:hypothetical protein